MKGWNARQFQSSSSRVRPCLSENGKDIIERVRRSLHLDLGISHSPENFQSPIAILPPRSKGQLSSKRKGGLLRRDPHQESWVLCDLREKTANTKPNRTMPRVCTGVWTLYFSWRKAVRIPSPEKRGARRRPLQEEGGSMVPGVWRSTDFGVESSVTNSGSRGKTTTY